MPSSWCWCTTCGPVTLCCGWQMTQLQFGNCLLACWMNCCVYASRLLLSLFMMPPTTAAAAIPIAASVPTTGTSSVAPIPTASPATSSPATSSPATTLAPLPTDDAGDGGRVGEVPLSTTETSVPEREDAEDGDGDLGG